MLKLIGIPYDANSSYKRGAALAPKYIRLMDEEGSANKFCEHGLEIIEGTTSRLPTMLVCKCSAVLTRFRRVSGPAKPCIVKWNYWLWPVSLLLKSSPCALRKLPKSFAVKKSSARFRRACRQIFWLSKEIQQKIYLHHEMSGMYFLKGIMSIGMPSSLASDG